MAFAKDIKKVPELRFPEFEDEWNEVKLGDVCDIKGRIGYRGYTINDLVNEGEGALTIGGKHITNNKLDLSDPEFLSWDKYHESPEIKIKKGDIITTQRGSLGVSAIIDKNIMEATINPSMALLKNIKISNLFLYFHLITPNIVKIIHRNSSATAVPMISQNELKKIKINIPTSEEQEKIANFLSKIDEKIELLEKTLELYQKLKHYYMNIIFEDLELNIGVYDYKSLDTITFYQEGPGVRNYQYVNEGIKLLNVRNFVENELILDNTDRHISFEEAYGPYKHFLVDEGDLLIACSGIKAEYFNEKITFAKKEDLPLCMNTSTMRFKSLDKEYLNLNYLKWYFQTNLFKKQIFRVLTGSAQFNFGPTHLKYLKVIIPPIEKQEKIAEFLDINQKQINLQKEKIKYLRGFKKELLRKLFI